LGRLDDSFRIMREFMAEASHELRTPLAIIHGEADVSLSQVRSDSEYRESLDIIRDQSKRMTRIVSDMLALARADAGRQLIHVEELYLNDVVDECCHALKTVATAKNVRIQLEPSQDFPFVGDEELLKRMVLNLLDNAIRYTPPGGLVVVRLTGEPTAVRIVITDTGVGIASTDLPRIFQRFYRVDASAHVDQCSGLGLAIVKMAAEAHQGSVQVSSQPGYGSTFTITLPWREPASSLQTGSLRQSS
jgi:two-component system OmpR family sensor kinase